MVNEAEIAGVVVGGQPAASDLQAGRFAAVVNCRPHDEPGNHTAALAEAAGIPHHHVPFTADTLSGEHIARVREVLDRVEGTVLVHCQGGTRAAVAVAVALAEKAGAGAEHAISAIAAAGYEIKNRPYEAFIHRYFGGR